MKRFSLNCKNTVVTGFITIVYNSSPKFYNWVKHFFFAEGLSTSLLHQKSTTKNYYYDTTYYVIRFYGSPNGYCTD